MKQEKDLTEAKDLITEATMMKLDGHLNYLAILLEGILTKKLLDCSKVEVKRFLARGAFGSVYRCSYEGQDVAVKVLDWGEDYETKTKQTDLLRIAFMEELSIWLLLDHPNISKLIGGILGTSDIKFKCRSDGTPTKVCCIVTEYQAGGTLASYLERNRKKKLDLATVVELGLQLGKGLSYLHSKRVVHRDIKPDNVLLDKNRTIKITDFGTAILEPQKGYAMLGFTGTMRYMAPEVFNSLPYTRKCDVYSFGICLWEIYCCDKAYKDFYFSVNDHNYQYLRPEIPKCCPSALAKLMTQCWDADPEKRPEMKEVVSVLEAIDTSNGRGMKPLQQPRGCFCF